MRIEFRADQRMTEHQIQSAYFTWVDLHRQQFPALELAFAVPNGAYKSKSTRRKFQREGLRPGVPDVCLPVAMSGFNGLWIEVKMPGKYPTPVQREWHRRLTEAGHAVHVCRSWIEMANLTIEYLKLPLEKIRV